MLVYQRVVCKLGDKPSFLGPLVGIMSTNWEKTCSSSSTADRLPLEPYSPALMPKYFMTSWNEKKWGFHGTKYRQGSWWLTNPNNARLYFRAILQDFSHTFALFWVIFSWSLLDLRFLPKLRIASDHVAWKTSKHMDPTKWWSFLTGGGWWMILLPIVTTLHGYGVMKIVVPWFCNMNDGYLANDAQLHIFVF